MVMDTADATAQAPAASPVPLVPGPARQAADALAPTLAAVEAAFSSTVLLPRPADVEADDVPAVRQSDPEAPPVVATATPSRRSVRHGVGLDWAATSDEDFLAKAMRRKAAVNLDYAGINKISKSFLTFPTPLIAANLNNVGVHLGRSVNSISVSANTLRCIEYDRIKLTPTISSKPYALVSDEDDEEVYAISDG
jgi:hypothetical protein